MRIICYTYEADYHCITCTVARFKDVPSRLGVDNSGVPYGVEDNEGNPIYPVFDTDAIANGHDHCGTCGGEL
jgi:hypothetical protein